MKSGGPFLPGPALNPESGEGLAQEALGKALQWRGEDPEGWPPGGDLAALVKRIRQHQRMNQSAFGDVLGLTFRQLVRLENGRVKSPLDSSWQSIARGLGTSEATLKSVCHAVGDLETAILAVLYGHMPAALLRDLAASAERERP